METERAASYIHLEIICIYCTTLSNVLLAAIKCIFLCNKKTNKQKNYEDNKAIFIFASAITYKNFLWAYTWNNIHHLYTTYHQFIFLQLWWQAPSFKNKHHPPNRQSIMHPYYVFKTLCFEKLPCIINKVVYPEGHGQARGMGWQEPQKFNKEKFKVLHLRSNNVGTSMLLRVTYLESSSAEKGPRRSPGGCQVENEAPGLH